MTGPEILTLGCRLNATEGEAMRQLAAGQDDLVIINSCAVTAEAVKQARQEIRRARRRRPDARILVTGCAAQVEPDTFATMPEVTAVIGNREKREAATFLSASSTRLHVSDIMEVREAAPIADLGERMRARAFVEVQNGCDHRCTFCIIPFGRGPSRSVPAGAVVERIKALVDEGYNEVVLTGVDTTSYGPDLPGDQSLGMLVERVLKLVPGLRRLRLSSLDSVEIDERLFELVTQETRIQPHLHLSLQAGDDLILKRMKRRHSRAQSVEMVERLKAARPEIAIGADLIAGFPTETDEMAGNTLKLLDDCDIVMGHIFPFSPRAGTPAAKMPQLDTATVRARAKRLREAADVRRARWLETLIGTTQSVLVEGQSGRGHAGNYAPARLASGAARRGIATNRVVIGDVVTLHMTHIEDGMLVGETL
jgi:threonylcarbamoyladenosine tRNA methylthiotransferase MtaB